MSQPEQTTETISRPAEASGAGVAGGRPATASTAPLLMGVKLPIRVLVGRARLPLRDIVRLGSGSVVELDCSPDDPVEIIVNDRVIARGEIVVVGGNYGVRVTKIESQIQAPGPLQPINDLMALSERLK